MRENTDLTELLRERKLKATSTRLEVLSIIAEKSNAISYSELKNALQDFDRVTLYRTIQSLEENGIIHKALKEENDVFFAMCSQRCASGTHHHQHIHFKCSVCKSVSCVQTQNPIHLSIPGYQLDHFEIAASGVCEACRS